LSIKSFITDINEANDIKHVDRLKQPKLYPRNKKSIIEYGRLGHLHCNSEGVTLLARIAQWP